MEKLKNEFVMNSRDAVMIVRNTLNLVDGRLVDHGERVAFLLHQMLLESKRYTELEKTKICILGIFHDIGAYKTDEIDKMVQFETEDALDHSIYGYLFLKYFTPMEEMAEAILYHHFAFDHYEKDDTRYKDIALMISLADRIDVYLQSVGKSFDFTLLEQKKGQFDPEHLALFRQAEQKHGILRRLMDGSYFSEVHALMQKLQFTAEEITQYLYMLVYSIDFRSAYTVTHTINTVAISAEIAKKFDYSKLERVKLYYGALLHDIGKIAIPLEILEFPGKLSYQAMAIMKTHVTITDEIIRGIINDEICDIAVRHHEKLDGSGYPYGLRGEKLTQSQRILAVADIISALSGRRSYKEAWPKERILAILKEMSDGGQLCPVVCGVAIEHYDDIMAQAAVRCDEVLKLYSNIMVEFDELKKRFAERPPALA